MRVMKFGGTSVAGAARMRSVAQQVAAARAQTRVFVVASAVSGVTQLLLDAAQAAQEGRPALEAVHRFERLHAELAQELQAGLDASAAGQLQAALAALVEELRALLQGVTLLRECSPQVLAHLSSFGERAACLLLGAWMDAQGLAPQRVDPRHVLPCSGDPLQATPGLEALRARLAPVREGGDGLWLMPGFFGGDAQGRPMCLGRGGSDYSAALVAAALEAQLLEIWTDVDGIFSADPRLVPEAFALPEVTFEEAMELAYFGAKVLHPKTIAPVRAARIPVRVCNSFRPEHPGTRVSAGAAPPPHAVRGLSFLGGIALLSLSGSGLKGVPGTAARVFAAMAHEDISVVLITQGSSECSISFCVQQADAARAVQALEEAFEPERAQGRVDAVDRRDGLAILSVVGDGMRQRIGTAGTFLSALAEVGCNVSAIAQGSSERSISAVVAAQDGPRALA
ncbi:MAG TPA: aspartate kinase, partial [Aggregicoccus sp.]|nr:aspartate kinase [Aggregicoccus sp.]